MDIRASGSRTCLGMCILACCCANIGAALAQHQLSARSPRNSDSLVIEGDVLDGLEHLRFADKHGNAGAAIYISGHVEGGMHNLWVENTTSNGGAAVWIWGDLVGGIHDSGFLFNHATDSRYGAGLDAASMTGDITRSWFEGNRMNSTTWHYGFAHGGALSTGWLQGNVVDSDFIHNTTVASTDAVWQHDGKGGALQTGTFQGQILHSRFAGNRSGQGGALAVDVFDGSILNSRFANNRANADGGALFVGQSMRGRIADSVFIDNQAHDAAPQNWGIPFAGTGGALSLYRSMGMQPHGANAPGEHLTIENSAFLGNRALTDNDTTFSGLGGAIFYNVRGNESLEDRLTIAATQGATTRFYGNRHGATEAPAPNAIHFAHHGSLNGFPPPIPMPFGGNFQPYCPTDDCGQPTSMVATVLVNIEADAGGRVLMLDPMSSQALNRMDAWGNPTPNLLVDLRKTGEGAWFLGGASDMRSANVWTIKEGTLRLTDVDGSMAQVELNAPVLPESEVPWFPEDVAPFFSDNAPPLDDAHPLPDEAPFPIPALTLGEHATLAGRGRIHAQHVVLRGTVAPDHWEKTGIAASHITADTAAHAVDVAQVSPYGALQFTGDLTLDGARFDTRVEINGEHSRASEIHVDGSLFADAGVINVTGVDFTAALPADDDGVNPMTPLVTLIRAGSGIHGDLGLTVANASPEDADFLQVFGEDDGKAYRLGLGLSWYSTLQDDQGLDAAHGTFTLTDPSGSFTLGGALIERSVNTGAAGWNGATLTKRGAGTLILDGQNTYTGLTTVEGGTLRVGGSVNHKTAQIAGDVTVLAHATLGGHGLIFGHVDMRPDSILSPGSSLGELNVGSLHLHSGMRYDLDVTPGGASDKVRVSRANGGSGLTTIERGTILNIVNNNNDSSAMNPAVWRDETIYPIIEADDADVAFVQADGVTPVADADLATVFTVRNPFVFLNAEVPYDFSAKRRQVQLRLYRNATRMQDVCATDNACALMESLDPDDPMTPVIETLTQDTLHDALESLTGDGYASARNALLSNRYLRDTLNRRMRLNQTSAPFATNDAPLWMGAWGFKGKLSGSVDHTGTGLTVGREHAHDDKTVAGVLLGYETSSITRKSRTARTRVQAYSVAGYAAAQHKDVQWRAGLAYSHLNLNTRRDVRAGNLQGRAHARGKGHKVQVFAEAARTFKTGETTALSPYLNVAHVWMRTNAMRETGTLAALEVNRQTDQSLQTVLGVRAAVQLPTTQPAALNVNLGWLHAFGGAATSSNRLASGNSAPFTVHGAAGGKNAVLAGVNLQAELGKTSAVSIGYQGQFGAGRSEHAAKLQVQMRF